MCHVIFILTCFGGGDRVGAEICGEKHRSMTHVCLGLNTIVQWGHQD